MSVGLPDGIEVVGRGSAPDPRLVDGVGLLRPQDSQDGSGLVSGAAGAPVASDGRVASFTRCPECRSGKHAVCAEFADVTDDDEIVPCLCPCRPDAP
ncbi:hypothetical protein FHS07_001995 [Microbacterium proteolyticum]|uniref:Uncharacterized protein n=1 Tax=Microbacterium proteolyticum TaxID=1572644 RepID=A0A7W5CJZ9_9MICO|nr:hypothetical protein [Microbacterium proteolyticum]